MKKPSINSIAKSIFQEQKELGITQDTVCDTTLIGDYGITALSMNGSLVENKVNDLITKHLRKG